MKVALLLNRENFEGYANWKHDDWELIHLGNGEPDAREVAATDADVIVADAITPVGPDIIEFMPNLKLIHSLGVGYNVIDIAAAQRGNVYVCNNPGVNAQAVAEQAVLLILALLKDFRFNEDMIYAGRQMEAKSACFADGLPELGSLSVGIVGYGSIGRALATRLAAFGCRIFYYSRHRATEEDGATYLSLDDLFASCDIISLHMPVSPETENMINDTTLDRFCSGAVLINTARGELVDNAAVVRALISGKLGGFGADTLSPEPVLLDNTFLELLPNELRRRVALSPHNAGLTVATFARVFKHIERNIEAVERGSRPDCIVNGL